MPGATTKPFALLVLTAALAVGAAQAAQAAEPPDAGTLLRNQPQKPPIGQPPAREAVPADPATAAVAKDEGPRLFVKSFRFEGATLIPEADLQRLVAPDNGKSLSLRQLQLIGQGVSVYYMARGYLARTLVQPQPAANGTVVIQIIEGRLGAVSVNLQGERLQRARVMEYLSGMKVGEALSLSALGEAVGLLNEQAGVSAQSALKPGSGEAAVDVLVDVREKPLLAVRMQADNAGNRATGTTQASAALTLLNPTGNFDAATLLLSSSEGLRFVSADYNLAVGSRGLRVGASVSSLDYESVQPALNAAEPNGKARSASVYASYPLKATRAESLRLNGSLDYRALRDFAGEFELGNRRVNAASLGVSGWQLQQWLSPGMTLFSVQATAGRVGLARNPAAAAADQLTRRTAGDYAKLSLLLERQSSLGGGWELQASLRGQIANGNLDSSERFGLGGPTGVRAYPVGEASGDEGLLLKLNALRQLGDRLSGRLFIDYGHITLNKQGWPGWELSEVGFRNNYSLAGLGAGIEWAFAKDLSLSATLAAPLGSNPGRAMGGGRDADGRKASARAWIDLQGSF